MSIESVVVEVVERVCDESLVIRETRGEEKGIKNNCVRY